MGVEDRRYRMSCGDLELAFLQGVIQEIPNSSGTHYIDSLNLVCTCPVHSSIVQTNFPI